MYADGGAMPSSLEIFVVAAAYESCNLRKAHIHTHPLSSVVSSNQCIRVVTTGIVQKNS